MMNLTDDSYIVIKAVYTDAEMKWHKDLVEVAHHIEKWGYLMPKDQKLQMDQCLYVVFGHVLGYIPWDDACNYFKNMPPMQADIYYLKGHFWYWLDFLKLRYYSPLDRAQIVKGIMKNYKKEQEEPDCLRYKDRLALVPYNYFNEIVHDVLNDYEPRH